MERYSALGLEELFYFSSVLPKATYSFNVMPIKTPVACFTQLEEILLKFVGTHKRLQVAKTILRQNISESIIFPGFKLCYKSSVIKTLWYWENKQRNKKKNRTDQWNKIESPELCPHLFNQQRQQKQDYTLWKNCLQ